MTNSTNIDGEVGSPERFYAKVFNSGTSKAIIIPHEIMKVNGWDTNTTLKVWVKKVAQKKEESPRDR